MSSLIEGDCIQELKKLSDNSIDACITDPPYELGFMGKKWDKTGIAYQASLWQEVLRVLKPGGHLLSFGGSRTYHRMACAIEDAGFEIRDCIMWVYGSGFPKSLNIGKAVDKLQGNERKKVGSGKSGKPESHTSSLNMSQVEHNTFGGEFNVTKGTSEWEGWGTALKPAHEPIVLARKPLSEKTVAKNVLKWGTGGINIDGCRVALDGSENMNAVQKGNIYGSGDIYGKAEQKHTTQTYKPEGRFPANFIHDGSQQVMDLFPNVKTGSIKPHKQKQDPNILYAPKYINATFSGDSGSAARFFYCAKASKKERNRGITGLTLELEVCQCEDNMEQVISLEKGISELIAGTGYEWNTTSCGNEKMGKSQKDIVSIILMATNKTTPSKTWSALTLPLTREFIVGVTKIAVGCGLSLAVNADNSSPLQSIMKESLELARGVKSAASETQLKISVKENRNGHPTIKPLALMKYLVKLISREGQTVLDPFLGSGTTGIACKELKREFIGIEKEKEYIEIAKRRIGASC